MNGIKVISSDELDDAYTHLRRTGALVYALGHLFLNQRDNSEIIAEDLHAIGHLLNALGDSTCKDAATIRICSEGGDA